jgi:hypothetical protein
MKQSQVWKKRSAGLTTGLRADSANWLKPSDTGRTLIAAAPAGQRKAGVKQRKY